MKKIVAYINTNRVHWLVDELGPMGIQEIVVTEYFRPTSQISRFELLVEEKDAENVRGVLRRVGSNGTPGDHFIELFDAPGGNTICGPPAQILQADRLDTERRPLYNDL